MLSGNLLAKAHLGVLSNVSTYSCKLPLVNNDMHNEVPLRAKSYVNSYQPSPYQNLHMMCDMQCFM